MTVVTKETTFDAAHMLGGYDGKCRNVHGHTYRLEVSVRGEPGADGMVADFGLLKRALEERVVAAFDHAFLYHEDDPLEREIGEFLAARGLKTRPLPCRTTSENLARHICGLLAETLPVSEVRLRETPTSCVTYRVGKEA